MLRLLVTVCLAICLLVPPAFAQQTSNIIRDYENDLDGDPDRPMRVRLNAQNGLSMGRMAGIWGTVGGRDRADAVFLGKTPDYARMQFDLSVLQGSALKVLVTAKDGSKVDRHEIRARNGEHKQVWLRLKGNIVVQVMSADPDSMSADPDSMSANPNSIVYALYFWYPGDTIDALTDAELDRVKAQIGKARTKVVKAVKGAGK